ncbi:hypothetical protein EZV61_11275 [Corallincola luteus]|uniref:Lipoprotein n=1 Tax=Corallincola luteus TaxID=1775177 RepID=A0ABY2AN78_9GAMM|nr:hypothetical protein [Corallincola luteus]TCI02869.1 hypothetical protein EZV61_11275 [Corallincola luteus]
MMKIKYGMVACLCCLVLGCASNGQGAGSQSVNNANAADKVLNTLDSMDSQSDVAAAETDNGFASVNFFRAFAADAAKAPVATLDKHFSNRPAKAYIKTIYPDESEAGFVDVSWDKLLPTTFHKMMEQVAGLERWEFIHSQTEGNYIQSYFALGSDDSFDYLCFTWDRDEQNIVNIRQMLYRYGLAEALVAMDRVMESSEYTQLEKVSFIQTMHAINNREYVLFDKYFSLLSPELQSEPFIRDRLLKDVAVGMDEEWLSFVEQQWTTTPQTHSSFYGYYLSRNDYDNAVVTLNSLPEFIANHVGIHIEQTALYLEMDKIGLANHYANESILSDPYLTTPYYYKLMISLKAIDYEGALLTLHVLRDRFNVEYSKADILEMEGGKEFTKSSFGRRYFG